MLGRQLVAVIPWEREGALTGAMAMPPSETQLSPGGVPEGVPYVQHFGVHCPPSSRGNQLCSVPTQQAGCSGRRTDFPRQAATSCSYSGEQTRYPGACSHGRKGPEPWGRSSPSLRWWLD